MVIKRESKMKDLHQLRIVIVSPNDVKEERAISVTVIGRVSKLIAEMLCLTLRPVTWETDSYPGFHAEGPQGQIDSALKIDDCDIIVGIFWKRLGTLTKDGKTGTQHEIMKAYDAWKKNRKPQIMLYFSQKPSSISLDIVS